MEKLISNEATSLSVCQTLALLCEHIYFWTSLSFRLLRNISQSYLKCEPLGQGYLSPQLQMFLGRSVSGCFFWFVVLFFLNSRNYPIYISVGGPHRLASSLLASGGESHICGDHVSSHTHNTSLACSTSHTTTNDTFYDKIFSSAYQKPT